jgi:hypothetical protein
MSRNQTMPHITFIHGIANKPAPDVLLRLWRHSLAMNDGLDLGAEGVTSTMVYWADVMYESPKPEMAEHESNDSIIERRDQDLDMGWKSDLDGAELSWARDLEARRAHEAEPPGVDFDYSPDESDFESIAFERIPLPWWLKRRLMKTFLRDVHHYLFNTAHSPREGVVYQVQDEIRSRFLEALANGAERQGPHIVVSHSMGTVIAYDCLKRVPDCPAVDGLITIGSPLGLDEVQDKLRPEWTRADGYPIKAGEDWVNIYDKLDPVAGFDPKFANDYRKDGENVVLDINEQNSGSWRHNISKYLSGTELRAQLIRLLRFDEGAL